VQSPDSTPAGETAWWGNPLFGLARIAARELIGGLLILLGVRVRWVALLFVAEFLVTTFYVKLFNPRVGYDATRIDLMMLAAAVMLVLAGAGKLSFDEWWARRDR
jgi:uncharacterized membrane protein YphA (DoxX/SURF4 family)